MIIEINYGFNLSGRVGYVIVDKGAAEKNAN